MAVYSAVIERWNIGAVSSFTFGSKEKYVPLQAADIYAYEANKRLRDPSRPNRRALDAIVPDKKRAVLRYLNRENMAPFIEGMEAAAKMDPQDRAAIAWLSGFGASEATNPKGVL